MNKRIKKKKQKQLLLGMAMTICALPQDMFDEIYKRAIAELEVNKKKTNKISHRLEIKESRGFRVISITDKRPKPYDDMYSL